LASFFYLLPVQFPLTRFSSPFPGSTRGDVVAGHDLSFFFFTTTRPFCPFFAPPFFPLDHFVHRFGSYRSEYVLRLEGRPDRPLPQLPSSVLFLYNVVTPATLTCLPTLVFLGPNVPVHPFAFSRFPLLAFVSDLCSLPEPGFCTGEYSFFFISDATLVFSPFVRAHLLPPGPLRLIFFFVYGASVWPLFSSFPWPSETRPPPPLYSTGCVHRFSFVF